MQLIFFFILSVSIRS